MNERLLARLLFGFGILAVSLFNLFGLGWSESGALARVAFVVFLTAAVVGIALDIKHRHQDKRRVSDHSSGAV